ncbi:hypothetical protein BDV95DRAFT_607678 [Massariosphaeria phaeospora]|uniref:Uncharacterized protein n=1 Tax=Massariosphaeria phaeospora TaxID=100035 RepID=A0A7C8I813_9PLEO|nr:hypothetical protein BDV95DRAFT_607678 [Massariosphaeria phaeospora]
MRAFKFLAALVLLEFAGAEIAESDPPPFNLSSLGLPALGVLPPGALWQNVLEADDDTWEKAKCKGKNILDAIDGSDSAAAQLFKDGPGSVQSRFTSFPDEFKKWYYFVHDAARLNQAYKELDKFWGIGDALRGMGVSDKAKEDGGKFHVYLATHGIILDKNGNIQDGAGQHYWVDGKYRRTTGAQFGIGVNRDDGVIMAMNRHSPVNAVGNDYKSEWLPELRSSSDAMFGLWKMTESSAPLSQMRAFISLGIANPTTKSLIARVLGPDDIREWPGYSFGMHEDDARVLLGSPNALGLGYLLIQHKQELGDLRIIGVNVFECKNSAKSACLVFEIKRR